MTSRRHFIGAAAATMLAGASTTARAADSTPAADSRKFRLGLSQPKDSPNYLRLKEMADRIAEDTRGAIAIEIFPESQLGNDSAMIAMVQKGELEMYLGGNVFGPLVPMTEMPGLPFTFRNSPAVFEALDNDLGDIIRAELAAKGLHAFRYGFDNGFHQITTSNKPIRTVDDLAGMKIRTPVQTMTVEFFQALGAKPMTFTLNKLYEVCKDRTVDGQTDPLQIVVLLKLDEVQAYLSLTNHWWSGFTLVANEKAWNALPDGIRSKIEMHAKAAALLQRQDVQLIDGGAVELLRGKGMIVNTADTSGFRKPLSAFYARWKGIYGDKAWAALEARVGKLV
jgi:tripartite ATP-independent transporter DctP family solute receptor